MMLVLGLKENLLSVGQMMEHGSYLLFGGNVENIFDGWSLDKLVVRLQMKNNRGSPLTMMPANQLALQASVTYCLHIWHKWLGHLNDQSIKLLEVQEMVHGLPKWRRLLLYVKAACWESNIEIHFLQNPL
ncbi:hypothetical protein TB1_037246 [Malus domestica]